MSGHVASLKSYFGVFIALMVLTCVTVWVSYLKMPPVLHVIVALAIAFFKASLVVAIFMHVKDCPKLIALTAVIGLFFLAILAAFTLSDYVSREWLGNPLHWYGDKGAPLTGAGSVR